MEFFNSICVVLFPLIELSIFYIFVPNNKSKRNIPKASGLEYYYV